MRMMLRWTVPVERGNRTIQDGTMTELIETMVQRLRPEASYFWAERGRRAGLMVFDMDDQTRIPSVAEPLFLTLDAEVEFVPVMNADDLQRALSQVAG